VASPYQTISSTQLKVPVAVKVQGDLIWVADRIGGLLRISGNNLVSIKPDSPDGVSMGAGMYLDGNIWAAAGSVGVDWKPQLNENGFFKFDGGTWKNYNRNSFGTLDSTKDIITIAGDPVSGTMYAGSFGGGLIELAATSIKIFKQNSLISSSLTNPGSFQVSGLAVDDNKNLWISNYGSEQNLIVRKKDGSWKKFSIPFPHTDKAVGKIMIDPSSRKWIISPKGNGLFCFDDGGTIDQTSDDKWRFYRQGKGNGNLPSSNVFSVVADRNGFIWVGTDKGIGIIECGDNIFNSGDCDAILPVVQQDNYAGLLFGEETVNDIAVDGADRKWIATNNGVWLVSSDGQKLISRFTETNSPLLGNKIYQVVIHKVTGEVFFFTNNGICSFRGTATEPVTEKQKPLVFPNPVPPGYNGSIAIRNLPENSWIKITELDGRLVHQGRSLGGQAIWNGKNYKGEKVSSNVYLVFILDQYNTQQLSTKIFFIK
jgi:streptogramin lyase